MKADSIIKKLNMRKIDEGGYCTEGYYPESFVQTQRGERRLCTTAYYVLKKGEVSCFHRLKSDELWLFHSGSPFAAYVIKNGKLEKEILGADVEKGEKPQILFHAGDIFGAVMEGEYGFCSCVVSPGFDERDIELIAKDKLGEVSGDKEVLEKLCYKD